MEPTPAERRLWSGAYMDGHHTGGEDGGRRAVQQSFIHAGGECIRTVAGDRVRVVDQSVPDDGLVAIQWNGTTNLAFARDLSN